MNQFNKYGSGIRDVLVTAAKNAGGEYGKEVLSGENSMSTPDTLFRQIMVISDTVFAKLYDDESIVTVIDEDEHPVEVDTMNTYIADAGLTVKEGTVLYGRFHDISLVSGTIICYKEAPGNAGVKMGGSA